MLVGVADDLAQVSSQILAGEGQRAPRQLRGARLALGRGSGGGNVPSKTGGGGGGSGGGRGGQGRGAGRATEGVQGLSRGWGRGRLVEEVVVVVGRRRVVQGSGAAVLDRLGRARLKRLL